MTVSYQKSFWIGDFLQHKIGIEVTVNLPNDTAEEALDRAIAFVNERNEAINPYQLPSKEEMKGTVVKPVDNPEEDDEANRQFEGLKKRIADIDNREDAQEYLNSTKFKHTIEAKLIVNSKPNKK